MRTLDSRKIAVIFAAVAATSLFAYPALADSASVTQLESFLRSVIQVIAGFAGLVAAAFFVIGGFTYITSSGNPIHLERAKNTLKYAALGLAITIAAFALTSIVSGLASSAFGS